MANFSEDDKSFSFTDGLGETHTYAKTPSLMVPGGIYEVTKKQFGDPPPAPQVQAPTPPPPQQMQGGQTFDPTGSIYNQTMNQNVDQNITATPAAALKNAQTSANQAGVPAAADPANARLARPGLQYGTETEHKYETKGLSGETKASLAKTDAAQVDAIKARSDADAAKFNRDAEQFKAEEGLLKTQNDQREADNIFQQAERRQRMEDIDKVQAEFDNMHVDSNRLFGENGTGSKLLAVIGMSLGALGGGLAGRDFGVNQLIQKAIDADIDAQKAEINKAESALKQKRGAYQDFLQATRDTNAARDLEHARQLGIVEKHYQAIAAGNAAPEIKARAAEQLAAIQQKRTELLANATGIVNANVTKTMPMTKQMGEANDQATMDKVEANAKMLSSITRLRELKKAIGTSPIEGRWQSLKGTLGINSANESEFRMRLNAMLSDEVRRLSGATASDMERKFIETQIANPNLNDEAFDRNIDTMEKNVRGSNMALERRAVEQGKRPIDTEAYYQDYMKAQGGTSYGFKPAGK